MIALLFFIASSFASDVDVSWTQKKAWRKHRDQRIEGINFEIKPRAIKRVIESKKDEIKIRFILNGKWERLKLTRFEVGEGFSQGLHYRGHVLSDKKSFAQLSFFESGLTGFIEAHNKKHDIDTRGNIAFIQDITELKNDIKLEHDALEDDTPMPIPEAQPQISLPAVKVYFETDYQMFLSLGQNEQLVGQRLEAMWAQVVAIYLNDGINVQSHSVKVWTTPDPYSCYGSHCSNSIRQTLDKFEKLPTPAGSHLKHLVTMRGGWGGLAWVGTLCNSSRNHAVSSVNNDSALNPIYNFSTMVIAHEIGHNIGSRHTHHCSWNVGGVANQAIDGCWTPEGSCARPSVPAGFKGTVMSYCHMNSGIDLRLGFGDLPKARLIQSIQIANNNGCLRTTDTQSPTVRLLSPTLEHLQEVSGVVDLNWELTDNDRVSSAELFIYTSNLGQPIALNVNDARYSWDTRSLQQTTWWLEVRARDPAGNVGNWMRSVRVVAPPAPPPPPPPVSREFKLVNHSVGQNVNAKPNEMRNWVEMTFENAEGVLTMQASGNAGASFVTISNHRRVQVSQNVWRLHFADFNRTFFVRASCSICQNANVQEFTFKTLRSNGQP